MDWEGGSNSVDQPGVYGSLGTPATGNIPGGRSFASSWTDSKGNFWLFGGVVSSATGTLGDNLNDLWEFNQAKNEWTWMGGSNTINQPGVYGTLGTPSAGNIPGGRNSASSWTDSEGNLWLFGGSGDTGPINDLWEFNPATNEWTWISGSSTAAHAGVYGTLGTPSAGNVPGGRYWAASWIDSSGNFWIFGGYGFSASVGYLNDLWEFDPAKNEWVWMGGSSNSSQTGVYGTSLLSKIA
jgi:hypothetical protein